MSTAEAVTTTTTPADPPLPTETRSGIPVRDRAPKGAERTSSRQPTRLEAAYADAKAQHSEPEPAAAPVQEPSTASPDTTPTQSKAPEPDASSAAPELTFLSDEEISALQSEHANDPNAYRKALDKRFNKALTPRLQKLADLRKALEPYADTLDGLESSDPAVKAATIQALAQKHGVSLGSAEPKAQPETSADAVTIAKEALGPELDFLAEKIAPAIERLMDRKLATTFEPVKARLQAQDQRTAQEDVTNSMQAFETKHQDWKQHEARMTELAQSFPPNGNIEISDWMESLYKLATYDTAMAHGEAKAIQRMSKAAKSSETGRPAISESHVRPVMPANPKWRDIVEASKRGERWE